MEKIDGITKEELKEMFLARRKYESLKSEAINVRLFQALGTPVPEKNPETDALREKVEGYLAEIVAERLIQDQREIPLISSQDTSHLAFLITADLSDDEEGMVFMERYMKSYLENIVDAISNECGNPYDVNWKWIAAALEVSHKHGITLADLVQQEEMRDELTKEIYTKEKYFDLVNSAFDKFISIDWFKTIYWQPLYDAISDDLDPEMKEEMKEEIDAEWQKAIPHFQEMVGKIRPVLDIALKEEILRIYHE